MKLSHPSRFVAALIALFSVLFMQFAVAAYVCPGHQAGETEHTEMRAAAESQYMADCQGTDMEQPNSCHAHDQAGNQSLDKPQPPQVQAFVSAALALTLISTDIAHRPPGENLQNVQLSRSTAPPLSVQYCCFRI